MQELMDGQPLFPGDSDVDQLHIIQKLLGPITAKQSVVFLRNPRFSGFKFGDDLSNSPAQLDKRYRAQVNNGKMSLAALDFMKRCLRMDPAERLTITECLQHAYFAGMQESTDAAARFATQAQRRTASAKRAHSAQSCTSTATRDDVHAAGLNVEADEPVHARPPAKRQVRSLCRFCLHFSSWLKCCVESVESGVVAVGDQACQTDGYTACSPHQKGSQPGWKCGNVRSLMLLH
jgi:serine/threonine protein kinase